MGTRSLARYALMLALAVLGAAAAASADPRPSETAPHLLVVPAEGAAARALAQSDARVIARYQAFTLVEAAGDDASRLERAGADLRDDMRRVKLGRTELDPKAQRGRLDHAAAGPGLAVVQFVGPIKDAWLERLSATGVRVVTYMAENGYLVRGSAAELSALERLAAAGGPVRAVVAYTSADKLGPGIGGPGRQRFAVQTLSGDDGVAARRRVERVGRAVRPDAAVGPFHTEFAVLDATEARALAADAGVVSVQPSPAPKLYDERADQVVAGAVSGDPLVPTAPGYLAFHNGLGLSPSTFSSFVVDVTDEGIDTGSTATSHPDFHEGGILANPSRIAYADNYTRDSDARDCGGHGTINASIIGGYNDGTGANVEDVDGFNYGLGVAPRVRVGASKIFRCATGSFDLNGKTLTTLAGMAYGKGARVANHSWGADTGGAYTADSQELDRIVRDAQPAVAGNQSMVELVAAGNAGALGANTVGSPATAKNVIAVGASESPRASGTDGCNTTNAGSDDARDIASFSSRGPTDDARVKPELVAPGTHITGAQSHAAGYDGDGVCNTTFPAGSTLYNLSIGTSHSTPVVTGMAALFREWFLERRGVPPSPALTRAALANSALDENGGAGAGGSAPNSDQGWGLANLPNLLDGGPRYFRDQTTTFGASGASFQRTLDVPDSSKRVRVTLAWTDPPGPTTGNSFVNNLDLTVTSAAGTFKGNVFSGGGSVTGGLADTRDNLESVYLPSGTSGPVTVTVTATNVAGDGVPGNGDATDQDFALVASNSAPAAPAQPTGLVATPGTRSVSLDWADVANATGYEVFRRPAGASYPSSPTGTPASSAFADTGLTPGAQYCYVVRAMDGDVSGPPSEEQCATVPGVPAPAVTATDPPSPANDNTPQIIGTAVAGSTVRLYTTSDCSGAGAATGTASQFASTGIAATVADNSSTTFKATAEGADGHESACSANAVAYLEDSTAPAPPSFSGTAPASPADDNSPRVIGAAEAGSTVRLYTNTLCGGTAAATGPAGAFASPGLLVGVGDNVSTTFYATATDPAGNVSSCSLGSITYVEHSTPPGGSEPQQGGTTGGTGEAGEPAIDLSSLRRSRIGRRGVLTIAFGAAPRDLAGTIVLRTVRGFGARKRRLVVARKAFKAAEGRTRVKVRLTRRGLRLLKRVRRLRVDVKVTLGPASATRRVTLRAPRPRR